MAVSTGVLRRDAGVITVWHSTMECACVCTYTVFPEVLSESPALINSLSFPLENASNRTIPLQFSKAAGKNDQQKATSNKNTSTQRKTKLGHIKD